MPPSLVTVFGGSGFLGRRIVARLAESGIAVRAASRHPGNPAGRVDMIAADIRDGDSVARALDGADAAVNCVSLYAESATAKFHDVHVAGAASLAQETAARDQGLLHLSGIGADSESPSPYVRSRGRGEQAVRAAHRQAVILRPCVMFGPDDAFLNALDRIAALTPVIPLFGDGGTRLQPVHADDVAQAAVRAIGMPEAAGRVFELGGPEVLTYREIVARVLAWKKRRRLLLPLPFAAWDLLAWCGNWLPAAPVSEGQVALMKRDNVASAEAPGFGALGLTPQALDAVLGSSP